MSKLSGLLLCEESDDFGSFEGIANGGLDCLLEEGGREGGRGERSKGKGERRRRKIESEGRKKKKKDRKGGEGERRVIRDGEKAGNN